VTRHHLLTACAALLATAAAGCGGGSDRPIPTAPATDAASILCAPVAGDVAEQTCVSAYFSCRDHPAQVREDSAVGRRAGARTTSVAYVRAFWADWEAPVREAALRGCRGGLADVG
jgi:hypothetical protein